MAESAGDVSVQQLREIIDAMLPDEAIRQLVLKTFADSIELANAGNPRSWSLYYRGSVGLRLRVAYLKMIEIDPSSTLYLLVDDSDVSAEVQDVLARYPHPSAKPLTDTPNAVRLFIPADQLLDVLPIVLPAYEKLILRVRHEATRYPQHHLPEVIRYLSEETGRTLPDSPHVGRGTETTVNPVRAAIEKAYPDPNVLHRIANIFADSIETANAGVSGTWSLSFLDRKRIRLTVGSTSVLYAGEHRLRDISPEQQKEAADPDTPGISDRQYFSLSIVNDPDVLAPENTELAQRLSGYAFKSPPNAMSVTLPVDQLDDLLPRFMPAHIRLVEQLRNWKSGVGEGFSREVFEFLQQETGRDLPSSPFEKSSSPHNTEHVRAVMEQLYPDPEIRLNVMTVMANSIELAHEGNPKSWCLTFPGSNHLRLNVGPMETVIPGAYRPDTLAMTIDAEALPAESGDLVQSLIIPNQYNKSYPSAERIGIPVTRLDELLPLVQSAHDQLIVGLRKTNSGWWRHHSPEALQYVREVTERNIPDPAYATMPATAAIPAWKLSIGDKSSNLKTMLDQQVMALEFDYIAFDINENKPTKEQFPQALKEKGIAWDPAPNHGPLQLQALLYDVKPGDRVHIYYDKAVRASGIVTGDYHYDANSAGLRHRRDAEFLDGVNVPLSSMSPQLADKMVKSFMALEALTPQQADELDRLIAGEPPIVPSPAIDWKLAYRKLFANEGLHYTPWQQAVFFTALQTKGFVILSGISGTGKTKIAQAFSAALPQPDDGRNVEFLTVRPDWRDSKSLLGYHNPITDRYEWTPFLRFLLRARESWEARDGLAWFVILDEMNLAHVEHYFAELLSLLESGRDSDGWTREAIQLPSNGDDDSPPASLNLPPNLHIIGTVNLDETTHAFSPKVLDRAFAMELVEVSFAGFPFAASTGASLEEQERTALLDAFSVGGDFPRIEQGAIMARLQHDSRPRDWLESLNQQLRPAYMHFGYRVFDEILAFVDLGMKNGLFAAFGDPDDPLVAPFDAAVQMKVLPKFHGSRAKLEDPLIRVLGWSLNPLNPDTTTVRQVVAQAMTAEAMEELLQMLPYQFPHTARRAIRLLRTAYVDGFAAFG